MSNKVVGSIGTIIGSQNEVASGGGGPYDGDMLKRVEKLENDVSAIKVDVATILSNYATKADLVELNGSTTAGFAELRADMHKIHSDISRWTMASIVTIIGAVVAGVLAMMNISKGSMPPPVQVPPAAQVSQPAPIIIYAQPQPAPVAPAAAPAAARTDSKK